ncbi:hypothetical protein, partial [Helicobacter typhlonius]|uniref:hypothetical protein n=1 Tax=Helicobacter typhlonius TaxID=76936 RepID=UPI002FE1C6F5
GVILRLMRTSLGRLYFGALDFKSLKGSLLFSCCFKILRDFLPGIFKFLGGVGLSPMPKFFCFMYVCCGIFGAFDPEEQPIHKTLQRTM